MEKDKGALEKQRYLQLLLTVLLPHTLEQALLRHPLMRGQCAFSRTDLLFIFLLSLNKPQATVGTFPVSHLSGLTGV